MDINQAETHKVQRELWRIWAKMLAGALPHLAGCTDQTSNLLFVILSNLVTALSVGDVLTIEHMAAVIHAEIDMIESGGGEDE